MTQGEFCKAVTKDVRENGNEISEEKVVVVVRSCLNVATETLAKGDKIQFAGFGVFSTTRREGYDGRNPSTGQPLHIPAMMVPRFKPAKNLKDAINA